MEKLEKAKKRTKLELLSEIFTHSDVDSISCTPKELIKSWIRRGLVEEVSGSPETYKKIKEESPGRERSIERLNLLLSSERVNNVVEVLYERLTSGNAPDRSISPEFPSYSMEPDGLSEEEVKFRLSSFCGFVRDKLRDKIISDKVLLYDSKHWSFDVSVTPIHHPEKKTFGISITTSSSERILNNLKKYISDIEELDLRKKENLEYCIRFLTTLKHLSLLPKSDIEKLDKYIEKYKKVFGNIFSESCKYCEKHKKMGFMVLSDAKDYIEKTKETLLKDSILKNHINPAELKMLHGTYYSRECGCYHMTSQLGSSRDTEVYYTTMVRLVLDIIKKNSDKITRNYKMELLVHLNNLLSKNGKLSGLSSVKKLLSEINECLGIEKSVREKKIEIKKEEKKDMRSVTKEETTLVDMPKLAIPFKKNWDEIVDSFLLRDYEKTKELIRKERLMVMGLTQTQRKDQYNDLIWYLGRLSFISLRVEEELNK